jgi:8-amino-7-oxononanoate synthase
MILDEIINRQLAEINQKGKLRILKTLPASVINFGSNDYLGLASNKKVIKAAQTALKECGLGATSSRLVAGNHRYYQVLEKLLAENKGYEKCLVFGSGYLANIGLMQAIAGKGDLILADKLAHNCLINGAKVSNAELKRFPHNNYQQLEEILAKYRSDFNNCFIIANPIC